MSILEPQRKEYLQLVNVLLILILLKVICFQQSFHQQL